MVAPAGLRTFFFCSHFLGFLGYTACSLCCNWGIPTGPFLLIDTLRRRTKRAPYRGLQTIHCAHCPQTPAYTLENDFRCTYSGWRLDVTPTEAESRRETDCIRDDSSKIHRQPTVAAPDPTRFKNWAAFHASHIRQSALISLLSLDWRGWLRRRVS